MAYLSGFHYKQTQIDKIWFDVTFAKFLFSQPWKQQQLFNFLQFSCRSKRVVQNCMWIWSKFQMHQNVFVCLSSVRIKHSSTAVLELFSFLIPKRPLQPIFHSSIRIVQFTMKLIVTSLCCQIVFMTHRERLNQQQGQRKVRRADALLGN